MRRLLRALRFHDEPFGQDDPVRFTRGGHRQSTRNASEPEPLLAARSARGQSRPAPERMESYGGQQPRAVGSK